MKAEKDVLKLVKDLNRHEAEAKKLRQALCDRFRDDFDGCYIGDFFVVDEPQGDEQDDGAKGALQSHPHRHRRPGKPRPHSRGDRRRVYHA